jgi:hypothetical protein
VRLNKSYKQYTWVTIRSDRSSHFWGGTGGPPPKPLNPAHNVDFGYPPKNRVFGVQNARMAGLVHLLFRIFRKNLSLIRGKGGPPLGGVPPRGDPPTGSPLPSKDRSMTARRGSIEFFTPLAKNPIYHQKYLINLNFNLLK